MDEAKIIEEVKTLNEVWTRAWFEKDGSTVDRLMAKEYVYVAPNGQILERPTLLEIIRSPGYKIHEGARSDVKAIALGAGAAVVLHRWTGTGTAPDGRTFKDDHRCIMVCARRDGVWQVVVEQCSPIVP